MLVIYVIVFIILLCVWLGTLCFALSEVYSYGEPDKDEKRALAGGMTLGLFGVILWPLIIPVAILILLFYGLKNVPFFIKEVVRG